MDVIKKAQPKYRPKRIKAAQAKYRPKRIKVLFVGESPPSSGNYFYYGGNSLLREIRRALGDGSDDREFLSNFMKRGWYLDDLIQTPVNDQAELKKKRRKARGKFAARIQVYKPSVVVCLLRRIRDDVETAVLMAGSDACVYSVSFAPQQPRRFREEMSLLRPRLERLP